MNVTLTRGGKKYEIHIDLDGTTGTVADLNEAVGGGGLLTLVDGRLVGSDVPLQETGLRNGSDIELVGSAAPRRYGTLLQLTGTRAGGETPLVAGSISIGGEGCDITVEGCPGEARLHTDSAGSYSIRNATPGIVAKGGDPIEAPVVSIAPGDRFEIGGETFCVLEPAASMRSGGVFNRPPRPINLELSSVVAAPPVPQQPAKPMRFGWAALVVPVVLGLTMAVLIHPRMAMFAIFSPAMLLANWVEDRRRLRREKREMGAAYQDQLGRFEAEVSALCRGHVAKKHRLTTLPDDLAGLARRADPRLWERRPEHTDFMAIPVGLGCLPWAPDLTGAVSAEAKSILSRFGELHQVPISVDLAAGAVCGIAGERTETLAIVRHILLQAAVHHGPADLAVSIFTDRPSEWDWAKWLPHVVVDGSSRRRLASTPNEASAVVALLPAEATQTHHLCVVDLPDLVSGNRAELREAIRDGRDRGISAVALAGRPLDLPSLATTILSVEGPGARVRYPDGSGLQFTHWRTSASQARSTAQALARLDDPELSTLGAGLPQTVHLESLLRLGDEAAASVRRDWERAAISFGTPIGVTADGPLTVDLVSDGPHTLMGGTTGSGKSELLRTLVASLAASHSPNRLNFVLIDYKGGSAFDACADLPHTVGLVTDLDNHLAKRALVCLEAELRYREHRLRDAGASDIASFVCPETEPLPRLLVVIDEFAALAKELPDFMDALVGIAQRGRSLGVHLLLATQRPSGVISESIKANTNLRVALRVQDAADSVDVIGCRDAADIDRTHPGRGLARFGPGEVVPFQAALVTGSSASGNSANSLRVSPFTFSHEQVRTRLTRSASEVAPTDLERIVAACRLAATEVRLPPARLPWPEALPSKVLFDDLVTGTQHGATPIGLADEPHRQRRADVIWSRDAGNLLLYGLPGSGTTTALATLAVGLARGSDPDRLHMYVFDFDDQALHPLLGLPHVGAVVGSNDRERQTRLLHRLARELQERRDLAATGRSDHESRPTIVVLLDNFGGFSDAFAEPGDMGIHNLVARIVADGPGVDILTIVTVKHPGDVPTRISSLVAQRIVFRLADRYDYSGLGVPPVDPPTDPGRAFESGSGREVQIALPLDDGLEAAVAANSWGEPIVAPWAIEVLPNDVRVGEVIGATRITGDEWFLPLGIGDTALSPAGLVLRDGDHALVTGPPRSGKSTALATLAAVAKATHPDLTVAAVLPRRSILSGSPVVDRTVTVGELEDLVSEHLPLLVLIDDAELVPNDQFLADVIASRRSDIRIVAAGSADAVRGLYGHWTQDIRRSRIGCALRPNLATDGDLWQTPLPRKGPEHFPVGRGYLLADGRTELVQLGRQ